MFGINAYVMCISRNAQKFRNEDIIQLIPSKNTCRSHMSFDVFSYSIRTSSKVGTQIKKTYIFHVSRTPTVLDQPR